MPTSRPGYIWDGTQWVPVGSQVSTTPIKVQGVEPSSPQTGDMWVDTSDYVTLNTNDYQLKTDTNPKGGGTDTIFYENGQTINTDYTITAGKNAGTFGPVSVATGITVTVPTGSVWIVV